MGKNRLNICAFFTVIVLMLSLVVGCSASDQENSSGDTSDTAQNDFPNKTVTIVTSSSPGSTLDTLVRTHLSYLSNELGVPVIVDNHPGGQFVTG